MSLWTWAWAGWAAYFLVVEAAALFNSRPGDTLSEHVWQFIGIRRKGDDLRQPTGWTRLRRFLVLAFMAWVSFHFLTGGIF